MLLLFILSVLFGDESPWYAGKDIGSRAIGSRFGPGNIGSNLVYSISYIDYKWPSDLDRMDAIANGDYIRENNLITGIKVFKDTVYVTVPRWRHGVPSSLNTLHSVVAGKAVLGPFPDWSMNRKGDCSALQYAQSMEVDPNTGYMWIIDTGRVNIFGKSSPPENLCPAKLVVLDLATNSVVRRYEFPDNVASTTSNFFNDIVLDYVDGVAQYAFITDTNDSKLYVYDYRNNEGYFFQHDSMRPQPLIPGEQDGMISKPIDGIAMSADFRYVYYCPLSTRSLFAIPTHVLRNKSSNFADHVVLVGQKAGGSDGMIYGQRSLFYAGIEQNAVYKVTSKGQHELVAMDTEEVIIRDKQSVQWADTFAFNGTDLWFVANKNPQFQGNFMDFSGDVTNMYIWKLEVGEQGYLWEAATRSKSQLFSEIPVIYIPG